MRIVLKLDDNSDAARFIRRRMHASDIEASTVARMLIYQVVRSEQGALPEVAEPCASSASARSVEPAHAADVTDDDAVLGNMLSELGL